MSADLGDDVILDLLREKPASIQGLHRVLEADARKISALVYGLAAKGKIERGPRDSLNAVTWRLPVGRAAAPAPARSVAPRANEERGTTAAPSEPRPIVNVASVGGDNLVVKVGVSAGDVKVEACGSVTASIAVSTIGTVGGRFSRAVAQRISVTTPPAAPGERHEARVTRITPVTPAKRRFARWFLAAQWPVDQVAYLFDVDPAELARAAA